MAGWFGGGKYQRDERRERDHERYYFKRRGEGGEKNWAFSNDTVAPRSSFPSNPLGLYRSGWVAGTHRASVCANLLFHFYSGHYSGISGQARKVAKEQRAKKEKIVDGFVVRLICNPFFICLLFLGANSSRIVSYGTASCWHRSRKGWRGNETLTMRRQETYSERGGPIRQYMNKTYSGGFLSQINSLGASPTRCHHPSSDSHFLYREL